MHSFWQQVPFVRLLLPFMIGIWIHHYVKVNFWQTLIFIGITGLCYALHRHIYKKQLIDYPKGILLSIACFLIGLLNQQIKNEHLMYHHYSLAPNGYFLVQIDEKLQKTSKGHKAVCQVLSSIANDGTQTQVQGKLLLNFKNQPINPLPAYGDVLLIKSGLLEFPLASFPGAFNYRLFMHRKGILFQSYVTPKTYKAIGLNQGKSYLKTIYAWQQNIRNTLTNYLQTPSEIAISEALLYGYDKDMDDETIAAFSRTGTLHVLAVSGMHVGLIFVLLGWLLSPLAKSVRGKKKVAILQTVGIWLYSLLCGMSPSILRATVMFSFVILGKQIKRNSNPFNSLAASAMFLLWFDPNLIYHVGFQLSYMAVAGILGFYPLLYHALTLPYKLLDEIWKILAVSLASQVLTLPLTLLYFHQFPNYFLLANLLIIPLTSLIIYGGILLLSLQWFPGGAAWLGKLMSWLILACNKVAQFIAHLPGAVAESIYWNASDIFFYLLALICLIQYFKQRNILALYSLIGLGICKLLLLIGFQFLLTPTQQIQVFSIEKSWVISTHKGKEAQLFCDQILQQQSSTFNEKINTFIGTQKLKVRQSASLPTGNVLLGINGLNLFIWQESAVPINIPNCIVLVQGKHYVNLEKMLTHNQVRQFILGTNMPWKKKTALKKILTKHQIPCHDLSENGAYELSL